LRKAESAPAGEALPLAFALRGADTAPFRTPRTDAAWRNREDL